MKDDELDTLRKVAKFWKPVGETACKSAMSAEDFRELESTILTTSMMDGEIASLMDRSPDFFYTEMLPSMAVSADVDNVQQMAEASAEVAAVLEAAKGRIKLSRLHTNATRNE